jgi:alpha-glucosidase
VVTHDAAKRTVIIDASNGKYQSVFKHVRLIIHGNMQIASATVNGAAAQPTKDTHAFLGGIQRFDPLGGASDNTALPVQTLTATMDSGKITFTY